MIKDLFMDEARLIHNLRVHGIKATQHGNEFYLYKIDKYIHLRKSLTSPIVVTQPWSNHPPIRFLSWNGFLKYYKEVVG